MKKAKSFIALVLAITFLLPAIACEKKEETNTPPTADSSMNSETSSQKSAEEESPPPASPVPPATKPPTTPPASSAPSAPSAPAPIPTPEYAQYIKCTGNNVNIRSGAGTNFSILGSAEAGTMYAIIGKTGNWYKTYYRNQVAYIYAEYASVFKLEKTTNKQVENIVAEGYKLLGVPYVYGAVRLHNGKGKLLSGFTAQKFDCSSLVQYIFYQGAGALLEVNTRTQVKQGKYVAKKDLKRGDCIYFTNEERQYNTGIERVGHVALYLGNDYILHTASDYARIEKMSAKRWSFYIEARRFL